MKRRILVTGASGLLGSALRVLSAQSKDEFIFATRSDADLEQPGAAEALLQHARPDVVIHAAAVVGGIRYNMEHPEELRDRNNRINNGVLGAAAAQGVGKVISFLSSCIFPADAPEPWGEAIIHQGKPDDKQWGYAEAKRALDLKSRELTARSKGKSRFVTLMPTAMYGVNDNFHPGRSHVIPAILLKLWEARQGKGEPVFWGTGRARREFLYAPDMARIALWAVDHYDDTEPLIAAPPEDVAVATVVKLAAADLGYQGAARWDTEKPDGRLTRRTDTTKFRRLLPDFKFMPFPEGLRATTDHFKRVYPHLRGLKQTVVAGRS